MKESHVNKKKYYFSTDGRGVLSRQLQCILEDPDNPPPEASTEAGSSASGKDGKDGKKMTPAQVGVQIKAEESHQAVSSVLLSI